MDDRPNSYPGYGGKYFGLSRSTADSNKATDSKGQRRDNLMYGWERVEVVPVKMADGPGKFQEKDMKLPMCSLLVIHNPDTDEVTIEVRVCDDMTDRMQSDSSFGV